jgi:thymidylate kinase
MHQFPQHATGGADRTAAPRQDAPALALVTALVTALDDAAVTWCHWKSNEAIDRSASADNDLDLLIARRDASRFAEVLAELGFRGARSASGRHLPGILDYYGLDHPSGRTVHVHAHFQLVVGDDMTKNFRLPIENAYLRSVTRDGLFPLPSAEFEYTLFVLRMVVKHSTWDAQWHRKGRLTTTERRELAYLEDRIDPTLVDVLVERHLPFIGPALFWQCARVAAERAGHIGRAIVASRLLHALRAHGRRPEVVDVALRVWRRRWRRVRAAVTGPAPRKQLDNGGVLIAVVGGDGAGKSTAVEMLTTELRRDFDTRRFHLGKPPWSRLTRLVKRPMRRLRTLGMFPATTLPPWHEFGDRFPGLAFVVWHLLTARDRFLEYRRARRATASGAIAVCDRFPVPALQLMDGPRTARLPGLAKRPAARWLAGHEAGYYTHIVAPDVLIVLSVPPDVAVQRRAGEDPDAVRRRASEVFECDWSGTGAVVVDASLPRERVHAQIRDAVWAAL